jgi:hypothetical protein
MMKDDSGYDYQSQRLPAYTDRILVWSEADNVLRTLEYSKAYNFGPNISDTLSVENMVEKSITYWGYGNLSIDQNSNNPHEAGLLKLDISRSLSELNWQPVFIGMTMRLSASIRSGIGPYNLQGCVLTPILMS